MFHNDDEIANYKGDYIIVMIIQARISYHCRHLEYCLKVWACYVCEQKYLALEIVPRV